MQAIPSNFPIAEYCAQMKSNAIVVNSDYQRSAEVWPPAARSYLIDTILLGFPIPKITLFQKTNLKTRKTVKEIVDGQQRSNAIYDFFNDDLRITGKSEFTGKRFSDLEPEQQQQFVEYSLAADILVDAKEDEIRQLFRRINSYTVPLNPQEQRHAVHQGAFKWFMVDLTEKYAQTLKELGVLKEKQLSRMQDAQLFTEIILGMLDGIETYAKPKLDKCYSDYDETFAAKKDIEKRFDYIFEFILEARALHNGPLMKAAPFYSLCLAITQVLAPVPTLKTAFQVRSKGIKDHDAAVRRLSVLADSLDSEKPSAKLQKFKDAVETATNTKSHRTIRFQYFCQALLDKAP